MLHTREHQFAMVAILLKWLGGEKILKNLQSCIEALIGHWVLFFVSKPIMATVGPSAQGQSRPNITKYGT